MSAFDFDSISLAVAGGALAPAKMGAWIAEPGAFVIQCACDARVTTKVSLSAANAEPDLSNWSICAFCRATGTPPVVVGRVIPRVLDPESHEGKNEMANQQHRETISRRGVRAAFATGAAAVLAWLR